MTVSDAQVAAALAEWHRVPGSDRVALRAALEAAEKVRLAEEALAEDQGPAASCHLCVGAGGYEDQDGAWIECSCQRDALGERARALAMARLFAEIEKAKGKVVLIGTVAEHLRRAHDDIRRAEAVLAETEAAVQARAREGLEITVAIADEERAEESERMAERRRQFALRYGMNPERARALTADRVGYSIPQQRLILENDIKAVQERLRALGYYDTKENS